MSAVKLLQALAAGLICGFVVSIPVGPVNLTVINRALRKGFGPAFLVGLGAICAETLYAVLMLAGHSSLLDNPRVMFILHVAAFIVITTLGVRYLLLKTETIEAGAAVAQQVDQRWHHPRSFLLGFVLTISNLMLVLLWATLTAVLFAREWVLPLLSSHVSCSIGVFAGGIAWFFLLAFFVSRAHRRIKPKTLTMLVRVSGVVFLVFGLLLGVNTVQAARTGFRKGTATAVTPPDQ